MTMGERVKRQNKWMKSAGAVLVIGLAGLMFMCAEQSRKTVPEPAKHDSPQATYEAAIAAIETKDYNALCNCLTSKAQDYLACTVIYGASRMLDIAARDRDLSSAENKPPWEASCRVLHDVLAKHGVKEDQLKSIQTMDPAASQEDMIAALAKFTTPIRDKPAFIVEMKNAMGAMELAYTGKQSSMSMFWGSLENIKVEGDSATAQAVLTLDGEAKRGSIGFKKVKGSWLLDSELMVPGQK